MTIHESIRQLRLVTGISQNELHRRSGVSQRNISYWESGKGCPRLDDCIRLARGLGITLEDLIRDVTLSEDETDT